MDINIKGVYRITNQVLPQMIEQGKGTIINIASIGAFVAGGGGAAYTSAKHAVARYTKQLSFDYGHKGIRANAIAPGAIETEMTKHFIKHSLLFIYNYLNLFVIFSKYIIITPYTK